MISLVPPSIELARTRKNAFAPLPSGDLDVRPIRRNRRGSEPTIPSSWITPSSEATNTTLASHGFTSPSDSGDWAYAQISRR